MCSRPVSDPANRLRKTRKKKSSAVPLFRSGHMSAICARLSTGKVGVQRGRKTAGCPSFLPPPRGAARSRRPQTANPLAESPRKTPRPLGANPPAAVRVPRSAGVEKGAAPSGRTRLRQFVRPAQPVQKRSRPVRANPLTQFECPAGSVQKRSRPLGANTPAAVRAPHSAGAEKGAAR